MSHFKCWYCGATEDDVRVTLRFMEVATNRQFCLIHPKPVDMERWRAQYPEDEYPHLLPLVRAEEL